jgi:hypothetical protein
MAQAVFDPFGSQQRAQHDVPAICRELVEGEIVQVKRGTGTVEPADVFGHVGQDADYQQPRSWLGRFPGSLQAVGEVPLGIC